MKYWADFHQVWYIVTYIEGINYVNLIAIGPVVIEIREVENGELVVPVNNTLVCHMAFLAADTRSYILIRCYWLVIASNWLENFTCINASRTTL